MPEGIEIVAGNGGWLNQILANPPFVPFGYWENGIYYTTPECVAFAKGQVK